MILRAPRIPERKRKLLLKAFILDTTATQAAGMAGVSRVCANRWFRHWRETIYHALRRAPRFEGEVEMDQSFIGGRGKKKSAAVIRRLAGLTTAQVIKRGKTLKKQRPNGVQVLGILQRNGDIYTQVIHRADSRTLLPIIHLVVAPGSTIYTDKWAAFEKLKLDVGYIHQAINHSLEYSDRKGRHINGVEAFWSFAKHRLGNFKGISRTTLPLHVKECEFRYNHRDTGKALKKLLDNK